MKCPQQNEPSEIIAKMSLLRAPGSILITLMKSLAEVLCTQTMFLSKQILTIVTGRQRDAQTERCSDREMLRQSKFIKPIHF